MSSKKAALLMLLPMLLAFACRLPEFFQEDEAPPTVFPPTPREVSTPMPRSSPPPAGAKSIPLPPEGHLYHAAFPGGLQDWGEEDDIFPSDLRSYEESAGKTAAWVYFSHNWFRERAFPLETTSWIRDAGSVPFIRLMLRSDAEQDHAEPLFTLDAILAGEFDADLADWGRAARDFGSPLLVEFGTEMNGEWFSWNGVWNGADESGEYGDTDFPDGPERFRDAYRHIIQTIESQGADNLTWVFHVNDMDIPEEDWNAFENYYPGDEWIDWIGVSVYGAQDPMDDECIPFSQSLDAVYPRLAALAGDKPIAVLEFSVADNNPVCDQAEWAREALTNLTSLRWPGVIGFSWWNENWQNDDNPNHDTHMRLQDNPRLAAVFQELVGANPQVLGAIDFQTESEPEPATPASASLPALQDVRHWLYYIDVNLEESTIHQIEASAYDMVVLDYIPSEAENTDFPMQQVIQRLHSAAHPKLVVAYIDIGEAEDYRTYWQPGWGIGDPEWIIALDPDGWEGNYPAAYWWDDYQAIWEAPGGYLDGILDAGFDGVYLDWVEAYSDENVVAFAAEEGVDPVQEMIWWVGDIAAHLRSRQPGFIVIAQNAAELAAFDEYVEIIDAIAQEQVWFDGGADDKPPGDCPLPATEADVDTPAYYASLSPECQRQYDEFPESTLHVSSESYLSDLQLAQSKGLLIFTVDYALDPANIAWVYTTARRLGFIPFVSSRALDLFVEVVE